MHIPDGYLSPQTYVPLAVAVVPFWVVALRKLKQTLKTRQIPLLALAGAFSFVVMMFNIPMPGGSSGHAVGSTLIAILLGPWAAVVAVSIAVVIQALVFGDGGITAIGANCLNMAVIMPFVGYGLYRLIAGKPERTSTRSVAAAAIASYVAINVAALAAAVEFGIQPSIAHSADGTPLYCPYGLRVAIPAMLAGHLTLFGIAELVVTAVVFAFLSRRIDSRIPIVTKVGSDPQITQITQNGASEFRTPERNLWESAESAAESEVQNPDPLDQPWTLVVGLWDLAFASWCLSDLVVKSYLGICGKSAGTAMLPKDGVREAQA